MAKTRSFKEYMSQFTKKHLKQEVAVMLMVAAEDYRNHANDVPEREKKANIEHAKKLENKARRLSGKSKKWLLNIGYSNLNEEMQYRLSRITPAQIEAMVEEDLKRIRRTKGGMKYILYYQKKK